MNAEVQNEFYALLTTMTIEEIKKYRRRVMAGKLDGFTYIDENCGCAYGTALYAKGMAKPGINYGNYENEKKYHDLYSWIDAQKEPFKTKRITPLEEYVWLVSEGNKPEHTEELRELIHEIDSYLKENS